MKTGLVVGKFYPPHAGHNYLIETAALHCDDLTIMIVGQDGQRPSPELREEWMNELYPEHTVILVPDIYDDDSSEAWADYSIEVLGEVPDIVFTSEEYGRQWAELMGSEHMLVDIERIAFPVSGTAVRSDYQQNWDYLSRSVQDYYKK